MAINFKGRGEHSINELEKICENFQDEIHKKQIKIQNITKDIIAFGTWISKESWMPAHHEGEWVQKAGKLLHGRIIYTKTTEELYQIYLNRNNPPS